MAGGSGLSSRWANDARGIPVARVCPNCEDEKLSHQRPEVLTDRNYYADEDIDGDQHAPALRPLRLDHQLVLWMKEQLGRPRTIRQGKARRREVNEKGPGIAAAIKLVGRLFQSGRYRLQFR